MKNKKMVRLGKVLPRILLTALLVFLAQGATPVLAGRQEARLGGSMPTNLLEGRSWNETIDVWRSPLLRPLSVPAPIRTAPAGTWSALGTGANGNIYTVAVSGTTVYVGGDFTSVGSCTSNCNYIAMWNGSTWTALGTGTNGIVRAIAVSGTNIYAGGDFSSAGTCTSGCNNVAVWNGTTWSALNTGMGGTNPSVYTIVVSGTSVYAGGYFTSAGACTTGCNNIAIWNSNTSTWSALGTGMGGSYPYVYTITVSGTSVYAGGDFTSAGGVSAARVARWNGSTWSALGTGMNDTVYAIAASSTTVYAGGVFTGAGTCTVGCFNIARWDGSNWSALGMGLENGVYSLIFNGSNLYVGGWFSNAGTCTSGCTNVAKWDGYAWSALGTGTNDTLRAIAINGSVLYSGGDFTSAGTCTSGCNKVARYDMATNANLSNLVISSGTLTPAFSSNTITYIADVGNGITDLTVTPTAADLGATIQVRINSGPWSEVTSGTPSNALSLNVGDNPINVLVIPENGLVTKTYTVTVTRAQPSLLYLPLVMK